MLKSLKKLEEIQEKRRSLQEKEEKIRAKLLEELSQSLMEAQALDIDFDILMGGILEVIALTKQGDPQKEVWKVSGQKFCRQGQKRKGPKDSSSAKAAPESNEDDQ